MCEFLRPFNVITNLISGTSYPISNLYFMQVWKIECLLKAYVDSEDSIIKDMTLRMKVKFDKYLSDYSVVLAFGVVLDLRMKLSMIKYCYSQLDSNTCQKKIDNIKSKLYLLFINIASGCPQINQVKVVLEVLIAHLQMRIRMK